MRDRLWWTCSERQCKSSRRAPPWSRRVRREPRSHSIDMETRNAGHGVRVARAPFPYPGSGHQWFDVDGRELRPDRIATVRFAFDEVVGDAVKRAGFLDRLDKVAFVGVSQGAIVALDAVASGRWPIRALVTFAGLLPPMPISRSAVSTSVLLIHGADDRTIPPAESTLASQRLAAANVDVESHILPGVGHTVSMEGAELAFRFFAKAFAEP